MYRLKCLNVFHATAAECISVYNYNYMHWYNIIEMLIELLIYSALVRARDAHIVYSVCIRYNTMYLNCRQTRTTYL